MTVTVNVATKEGAPNQFATMDPKQMIGPVYGSPNIVVPTICMNVRPTTPNAVKKPIEPLKTSSFRKLIPIISGLLTFATVLSILTICMDTSEIRLQKFRLNMTRDEELNIQKDNPELIAFIRWQLAQHKTVPLPLPSYSERHGMVPDLASEISRTLGNIEDGYFVQSLIHHSGQFITGPWLAENLNWGGLIVEPDAKKYFSLCKETLMQPKVQVIQACVSPNNHPKEIMLRDENDDEGSEVQINGLVSGNQSWFFPRAKCYPLLSLMLAVNRTKIDLLSLGVQGQEFEILSTIPFNRVSIKVITIHLNDYHLSEAYVANPTVHTLESYQRLVHKFLMSKSYRLVKKIDQNYIYRLNERRTSKVSVTTVKNDN